MKQNCTVVQVTMNRFGDKVATGGETLKCRWRYWAYSFRESHADVGARENRNNADALVWFAADAPVKEATILEYEGKYFLITQMVEARKLDNSKVHFKKCTVKETELTTDIS